MNYSMCSVIVETWAPAVWLHSQDPFYPSSIDFHLENVQVRILLLQLLLLIKIFHLEIAKIRRFLLQLFSPMKLYLESVKMSIFHLYLFSSIKFHFEYVSRVPHRYVWVCILDLPHLSLSILNRLLLR